MKRTAPLAAAFVALTLMAAPAQAQTTELRIGMVAPEGSQWSRVFRAWDTELRQASGGTLGITVVPGGGDRSEEDLLADLRAGRLDGAWVSSNALGQVARPMLVMAVPGLIRDYDQFNRVRRAVGGRFASSVRRGGFELLGWGYAGESRIFSDTRIQRPRDLARTHPWAPSDDHVLGPFLRAAGATPVSRNFTQVAGDLAADRLDVVSGSALVAGTLLWHTHLRYYTEQPTGIMFGGTLISRERYESLTEAQREALRSTGRIAHRLLSRALRREDARMLRVIGRRLEAVDTSAHAAEWSQVSRETAAGLAPRVFPQGLLDAVLAALAEE